MIKDFYRVHINFNYLVAVTLKTCGKTFLEAVQKVSDIATHINNHIKQHENFQKMLSIQKCFDKSAPKLLTPGREFIKEGILKKVKFAI